MYLARFLLSIVLAALAARLPFTLPATDIEDPGARHPAQDRAADEIEITPIFHGSLMLRYVDTVIHVDPWSQGDYRDRPQADILLITDVHQDHLDIELASRLMTTSTTVVGSVGVGDRWGGVDVVLENGQQTMVGEISIEAVPMYNIERGPAEGQLYHDPGRGNGYVIGLGDRRVYISGDTECTPEMRELRDIDIAFVSMNLPYTMTPGEAAECVKAFRPKVVYPYHYRDSDLEVFTWALRDESDIEVRIEDWYPSR